MLRSHLVYQKTKIKSQNNLFKKRKLLENIYKKNNL